MKNPTLLLLSAAFVFLCSSTTLEAQRLPRRIFRTTVVTSPIVSAPTLVESIAPKVDWYPYVIARAGDREWIRETPIEMRPNRPMHFWGNSRRRVMR